MQLVWCGDMTLANMFRFFCAVLLVLLINVVTSAPVLDGEREDLVVRMERPDYCDVIELVEAPSCGSEREAYRFDSLSKNCFQYLRDNCSTSLNTFDTYQECIDVCSRPESTIVKREEVCHCDWSYFRHYQAKKCSPVYQDNTESSCPCPVRFECPSNITRNPEECTLLGKTYAIGSPVETSNPCAICTCTTDLISCETVECPTLMNSQLAPNCHHIYDPAPNDCCPKTVCYNSTDENDVSVGAVARCSYKDHSYLVGERIFPDEDPCLTCVCTANWTGVNNASCRRHDCMIENDINDLAKGCVPIYQESVCCPDGYHCPNENALNEDKLPKACLLPSESGLCSAAFPRYFYDARTGQCSEFTYGGCGSNRNNFVTVEECEITCGSKRDQPVPANFKENRCYFENWFYPLGANLEVNHDSNCVTCTCSVPPDFTCIHRSCPPPPNDDYVNCVFRYKPNACCPEYECTQVSKSCPEVDCSEPGCVLKEKPGSCARCDCSMVCPPLVCAPGCALETKVTQDRCPECICNTTRLSRETICPTPQCAEETCKIVDGPEGCPTCQCPNKCEVLKCEPGCELVKDYPKELCPVCRCDSKNLIDLSKDKIRR